MTVKLTPAQQALLDELPTACAEHYAPAKALVRLGLAEWRRVGIQDYLYPKSPSPTPGEEGQS